MLEWRLSGAEFATWNDGSWPRLCENSKFRKTQHDFSHAIAVIGVGMMFVFHSSSCCHIRNAMQSHAALKLARFHTASTRTRHSTYARADILVSATRATSSAD